MKKVKILAIAVLAIGALGAALEYGVAQSTVVTQAEWAVYLAQGLGLDWNLPPNAKSNHYLARLEWTKSVEFQAAQMLEGSTATPLEDGSIEAGAVPVEALYEVAMLRAGDYGFRVKLASGGAVLKVADRTFDVFQPSNEPRWVDLDRVRLGPGNHQVSLMLGGGARADSLGVSPPCMVPVEPAGGWSPLDPLRFDEMAVTLARALDLEQNLPELGEALTVRGEEFTKTLVYPLEDAAESAADVDDPFWLASGETITTAVARFDVPEKGIYSIETRYISAKPVRWNVDSCLRVITCPSIPSQVGRKRTIAMELEAGQHELEVTLAPGAKLDRVEIQQRDGSTEAYLAVVEDEGFKMGEPGEGVLRRDALSSARRLRDRFLRLASLRCQDSLVALEAMAAARAPSASSSEPDAGASGNAPDASAGTTQVTFSDPVFPPVSGNDPPPGSPVQPDP
jgi:hypothetical protein